MRYFTIVRMPHPTDQIPQNVEQAFRDKGLKGVHTTYNEDGSYTLNKMPGTRIYQGKKLVSFEVMADQAEMQALLDANGLGNFEILSYREDGLLPQDIPVDGNGDPLPGYTVREGSLYQETGEVVTIPAKPAVYETRDVVDENGNVIGTQEVLVKEAEPEKTYKPMAKVKWPNYNHTKQPSKADLLDWMEDEYVPDPVDPENNPPIAQRPTELRLNYVAGTGTWVTVD